MENVAGTCVAVEGAGVLIRGPSGSGKSDLALRLIVAGAALVADDAVAIEATDGGLVARAPAAIRGLLEARGLGIVRLDPAPSAPLVCVVDLVRPEDVERHPEPATARVLGVAVPRFRVAPFEASAPDKVRLAVRLATGGIMRVP